VSVIENKKEKMSSYRGIHSRVVQDGDVGVLSRQFDQTGSSNTASVFPVKPEEFMPRDMNETRLETALPGTDRMEQSDTDLETRPRQGTAFSIKFNSEKE
jgi:hypothetical protein